ncbi:recombinase family protein [Chitinophaga pollutisoli]|uniref:Recombinase family protein n=1 Tax=Chitinophaga pollutisoli TaxID=3133966 RepID=A0ABZ2YJJ5_9BACT
MIAIGYVRISTKDQSKYSLDYQKNSIRDYCTRNKLELVNLFEDDGESSYTFDRPDWIALEDFIKNHKGKVQYLIVMDHDRFSRNLPEALNKISHLEMKFGIKVLATNEPIDLDPSDPNVFMTRAFKYMMANNELFNIRRRTSAGIRQALESGRFVNRAPFGYKNVKADGGKGFIVIDEERSFIVKKIFRDFLMGHPFGQICKEARALGFTYSGNSAIPRILNNCLYAGLIKVPASKQAPEKIIPGIHQQIISETEFWRAQELLGNIKPIKCMPVDEVPLRGILTCTCGLNMTAGKSKGKRKYYNYYRCRVHNNLNFSAIQLHKQLDEILDLCSFKPEQTTYIAEKAKERMNEALAERTQQVAIKTKELEEINRKIEKNEERFMEDIIEPETYRKWHKKFQIQKALLTEEINSLTRNRHEKLERLFQVLPYLTSIKSIYQKANVRQKHHLLRGVFKRGLTYKEGAFRTPFLHPALIHNEVMLKEKGLLFVEQPSGDLGESPIRSERGS